jgi:glyoxylase-like metal-dependent hydrolase (beta-lactamase superfamily II)
MRAHEGPGQLVEQHLNALGIWRLRVPVPFKVGAVNVYAVDEADGGVALVDTGAHEADGNRGIAQALAAIGRDVTDVRRIIITHGHPDHFGAARDIAERAGRDIPVLVHRLEAARIDESGPRWADGLGARRTFLASHGLPGPSVAKFGSPRDSGDAFVRRVRTTACVDDGDLLQFKRFAAKVLHLPGHTPGLVGLLDEDHGILFSSDHLLERGTTFTDFEPMPASADLFRMVPSYLDSLRRTRALEVVAVLPGHGAPFGQHRVVIEDALQRLVAREGRVKEQLSGGPRTAFELARALYPHLVSAGVLEAARTIFQLTAHLHALEERGEVARRTTGGLHRFELGARRGDRRPGRPSFPP